MAEYKNIQNDYKQKFENFVRVNSSTLIINYFYVIDFLFFYQSLDRDQLKAFRDFKNDRDQYDEDGEDESEGSNDEGDGSSEGSNEDSEPNGSNEEGASGASSDED